MYLIGRAFGKLPNAGGLYQQPAHIIEAFYWLYLVERSTQKAEQKESFTNVMQMFGVLKNA